MRLEEAIRPNPRMPDRVLKLTYVAYHVAVPHDECVDAGRITEEHVSHVGCAASTARTSRLHCQYLVAVLGNHEMRNVNMGSNRPLKHNGVLGATGSKVLNDHV